ncbi:hypothetical protein [Arthrobacter sp. 131MFCol6.1]|uniref:hypothetical protein n=1 Tax=Arthrobacter sp. 131MFCol6.1 TaxID=1157944 RepID=UPI0012DFA6C0
MKGARPRGLNLSGDFLSARPRRTGSFHAGSFNAGSFHAGSFNTGSFNAGSGYPVHGGQYSGRSAQRPPRPPRGLGR